MLPRSYLFEPQRGPCDITVAVHALPPLEHKRRVLQRSKRASVKGLRLVVCAEVPYSLYRYLL
jgi:hypothetical protein